MQIGRERTLARTASTRTLTFYAAPAFSPDGTRLSYTLMKLDRSGRFVPTLDALDLGARKSTKLAAEAGEGEWSPDGKRIAFTSVRDHNGESCGSDLGAGRQRDRVRQLAQLTGKRWVGAVRDPPRRQLPHVADQRRGEQQRTGLATGVGWAARAVRVRRVPREPTMRATPKGRGLWLGPVAPLPSADPVQSLKPPRFPRDVTAQVKRARKLGNFRRVAHALHMPGARARQLLAFAKAVEPFEPLKPANC